MTELTTTDTTLTKEKQLSLPGLPKELQYLVACHLHDDNRSFKQGAFKNLRLVSHHFKGIADEIFQEKVIVDMDQSGLYPSYPLTRLQGANTIQELTINQTKPTQRDLLTRRTCMQFGSTVLPSEEAVEDMLVNGIRGAKILNCHILYQYQEEPRASSPFTTCKLREAIKCQTLVQARSAGDENVIDRFLVTLKENGQDLSICQPLT